VQEGDATDRAGSGQEKGKLGLQPLHQGIKQHCASVEHHILTNGESSTCTIANNF